MVLDREGLEERRTWWGRFVRYWSAPIFWLADITDGSGKPVHSKVLSTLVILILLPTTILLGRAIADNVATASGVVVTGFVAVMVLEVAASFGPRMMELYLKTRGGGSLDALTEAAKAAVQAGARVKTEQFDDGV